MTFAEEFSSPDLSGGWDTVFPGNLRWLGTNGEKQIYLDANYVAADGSAVPINPFSIADGALTITAAPTPAQYLSAVSNQPYTSGMINTYESAQFKYGFFEVRADFPAGAGLWPALWLRSADPSVKTEIDIMEMLGQKPGFLYQTVHDANNVGYAATRAFVPDMTTGYHTYGVDWQQDHITFYFDGQAMSSIATPASLQVPMYFIANLAVGGWAGAPTASTPWPAEMKVDYIHVWQDASVLQGHVYAGTAVTELLTGTDGNDIIRGLGGADTLMGAAGNDWIEGSVSVERIVGGMGDDTLVSGGGADILIGGSGNDTYVINATGASIQEAINGGVDTIVTSLASWSLNAVTENIVFTGTGPFKGVGNASANWLQGGDGNATLIGSYGNDTLFGGAGNDSLNGGADDDRLIGGGGNDTLMGGTGHDIFVFHQGDSGTAKIADFSLADDRLDLTAYGIHSIADALAHVAGDQLVLGNETITFQNMQASLLTAQNIVTDGENLTTLAAPAAPVLPSESEILGAGIALSAAPLSVSVAPVGNANAGSDGNDTLLGTAGADILEGRGGDDVYRLNDVNDRIVEKADGGHDTAYTTLGDVTLRGYVENLIYDGNAAFNGVGNALDNLMASFGRNATLNGGAGDDTLIGTAGDDRLTGGLGDDRLIGHGGNDTMTGGDGHDYFALSWGAAGRTVITDFTHGVDKIDLRGQALTYADVQSHFTTIAGSLAIVDGSMTLVLQKVVPGTLTTGDFLF